MNSIDYERRKAVYNMAIDKYGITAQMQVAIEEMAELTKELCKRYRGKENVEAIAEEIADVTIMMEQLRIIFDVNDQVCDQMDAKVLRLADRLGMETHEKT